MKSTKKYYTLANRYIDKLIKLYEKEYFSTTDLEIIEFDFIKKEVERTLRNEDLSYKECFCFIMNYLVSITGLNKTELEEKGYLNNYETIDINDFYDIYISYKNKCPNIIYEYEKDRISSGKYDSLICLTNYENLETDLFYNIRNALLHSEFYPHGDSEDYTVNIFDFTNTDYHKIEGKILMLTFQLFLVEYYSNVFANITTKVNMFEINDNKNDNIKNENELREILKNMKVIEINNDFNNNINRELFELVNQKYKNSSGIGVDEIKNIDVLNLEKNIIEENTSNLIFLLINKYYGDKFYKMSIFEQKNCIYAAYNYLDEPKKSISEWLIHFYDIITAVSNVEIDIKTFAGSNKWALKPALYIMKLYNCLYAIQNKSFEDIDVDKLNISSKDVIYDENVNGLFDESFKKNKLKYEEFSDENLNKCVYLEIIRNSLSHGNISFDYIQNENGELQELFVFSDKYKSKKRTIYLKIEDVKKIIDSECFLSQNIHLKEEKIEMTNKM